MASDSPAMLAISGDLGRRAAPDEFSDGLDRLLVSPDDGVFVAVHGGVIAGWAHVFVARRPGVPDFAEIGGLVTSGDHRRRGIARSLVRRCETWARRRGLPHLRVRAGSTRLEAHRFYEDSGFERVKSQFVYDKALPTA